MVDFQNSFTATKSSKFPTKPILGYPPHHKCVAALPWKTYKSQILHSRACKTVSNVTFYHLSNTSAKCLENKCKHQHHAKYQHFAFCTFTVINVLKECLIAIYGPISDRLLLTLQLISEESVYVQMVDILNIFCEQTLANN